MFILASASPRRRELLSSLISKFEVIPSSADETIEEEKPEQLVMRLSARKAEEVYSRYPDATVLGADTVVVLGGVVLGKPKSEEHAKEMLRALAGKEHSVYTGVCVIRGGVETVAYDETKVRISALTEEQIDAYVATGSPMDKAGAYGIQDEGIVFSYEGSYSNVVGLPLELIKDFPEVIFHE
ncbi:MAG: septum formation protein Maf [Clostridia bacterium]|nr:septum formation protein Maf [Clostridia bacterium]